MDKPITITITITKDQLIDIADSILDLIDDECGIYDISWFIAKNYKGLISAIISERLGLGIQFTDEELGI